MRGLPAFCCTNMQKMFACCSLPMPHALHRPIPAAPRTTPTSTSKPRCRRIGTGLSLICACMAVQLRPAAVAAAPWLAQLLGLALVCSNCQVGSAFVPGGGRTRGKRAAAYGIAGCGRGRGQAPASREVPAARGC